MRMGEERIYFLVYSTVQVSGGGGISMFELVMTRGCESLRNRRVDPRAWSHLCRSRSRLFVMREVASEQEPWEGKDIRMIFRPGTQACQGKSSDEEGEMMVMISGIVWEGRSGCSSAVVGFCWEVGRPKGGGEVAEGKLQLPRRWYWSMTTRRWLGKLEGQCYI